MGIFVKIKEKTLSFNEKKPKVYVVASTKQQQVQFEKLLDEIAGSCGVGRAQVKASVEGLIDRMILFMEYGMTVKMGDFGTFRPTISSKAQKNVEDIDASSVRKKKIVFTPGKRFKNMLSDLTVTNINSITVAAATEDDAATRLPDEETGGGNDDDNFIDPGA